MEFLQNLLIFFYIAIAGLLVYLVLSQEPRQGAGDMFGGSTDLFSTRGVTGGLYRITIVLGVLFVALAFSFRFFAR
ncbi:preprotein translocase subunit SecG [Meiothermus taiwanensis]|uniref:Protein-export membrane protein SecG n=1 Tax=Meiothermus taiwanensis TaxID=172827 RepID=A0A399E5R7_9DEIN|nr:preprotein translocase subunit SecG [Meiothermus taiwanensis]KIQ54383.1 preprotein translocase subunit SecG [Meiothermus taiwanensis]KZK14635.1 preprotein translocase subunit SecG [Meiothermus taiwanensis]RIH77611.1 preprotein translocase, SecG subunit [Meiothermus taiwanensis]